MSKIVHAVEASEIDVKKLFYDVLDYKWMILLCVFLGTASGAYYAYFLPNVYRATASVKVGIDDDDYAKDVISIAMGNGARNAATEKDLLVSRMLSQKALAEVDFRTHYYEVYQYRTTEIYKNSPIEVEMKRGYGVRFTLEAIDEDSYRLLIKKKTSFLMSDIVYNKVHYYGEEINTSSFELIIYKNTRLHREVYAFMIERENKVFGQTFVSQNTQNSTVLHISVEDTVARRASEYCNALVKAYVRQNIENKTSEASERLLFINQQLSTVSKDIESSSSNIEDFRKESNIVNIVHKTQNTLARLERYESDLTELLVKEELLKLFYEEVKSNRGIETLSIEGIEDKESILSSLIIKLQNALIEKRGLSQDYTNLHPLVIKIEHKIIQLKQTITNTAKNLVHNVDKRKVLLVDMIEKQKEKLKVLPQRERTFGQLDRHFKMNEEISAYLLKQKSESEMVRASTISKNKILDLALLPVFPIKPKRQSIVFIGFFLGLFLGLAMAFLRILFNSKIQTESDITSLVEYPILGTVPYIVNQAKQSSDSIKVFESVKSATAESFRHIRSNLEFMRKKKGTQIILLTSTIGQEGKTTLAVNLAAIMSLSQNRTIILNLDFRKPTLHSKFNLKNTVGLSEIINNRVTLQEVIQPTRYPYLDIISSGAIPPNPSELIHNKRMYTILEEIKKGYDMIILDTPPIGLVTDVKELMHYVDMNIYILRADYSQKEFLENIKKLYQGEKPLPLSIVLNGVKKRKGGYGYYDGHGYYEE
ncbi:MAG: polysaccharide biosynthesis tyrosine autokinase [Sulfurovum sp.]|nr:polysaccharide biosynthesis tyrosine autokinase [Sulfurovum sp.]